MSIRITYQNKTCASCSISRSVGVMPDSGWIELLLEDRKGLQEFAFPKNKYIQRPKGIEDLEYPLTTSPRDPYPIKIYMHPSPPTKGFALFGDLEISWALLDGIEQTMILEHIFTSQRGINETRRDESSEESTVRVEIVDERILWQDRGVVKGDRNCKVSANGIVIGDTLYHPDTLKDGKELYTIKELIEECVKNLPHPQGMDHEYPIEEFQQDGIKNRIPADIEWGGGRVAAEALDELLVRYGLVLALTADSKIKILRKHNYSDTNERSHPKDALEDYLMEAPAGVHFNYRPFGACVYSSKPKIVEVRQLTTPVIYDGTDVIDLPEYCSVSGIDIGKLGRSLLKHHRDVNNTLDWIDDEDVRKVLTQQAFKWFQIVENDKVPMVPRHALEGGRYSSIQKAYDIEVEHIVAMKVWRVDERLWHIFQGFQTDTGNVSCDAAHGIVKMPEPQFLVDKIPDATFNLEDVLGAKAVGGLRWARIHITYAYKTRQHWSYLIGSQKYAKPYETDWQWYQDISGKSNEAYLQKQAEKLVAESLRRGSYCSATHKYKFAGAHDIGTDGRLTQVVYECNGDSVFTTVIEGVYTHGHQRRIVPNRRKLPPAWRKVLRKIRNE